MINRVCTRPSICSFVRSFFHSIQFNSVTSIAPKSSDISAQRRRIQIKNSSLSRSKFRASTGRRIYEEQGGGGGSRIEKKSFQHFSKKVTELAVLKLTGSEFQVEGAATAKPLTPILFDNVEQSIQLGWRI